MSIQQKNISRLTSKLRLLEKEQAQIEGELKGIDQQLEEIGITDEMDIDEWVDITKESLQTMRKKFSELIEQVETLLEEYEEENE